MLVFDTEANGLVNEITQFWCICIYDGETMYKYYKDTLEDGVRHLHNYDGPIMAHNAHGFDIPALQKLYPWFKPKFVLDSLICSQMLYPDIGLHGMKAWGERLGRAKPNHDDWTQFSDEMLHRCTEDVMINWLLWESKIEKEWTTWNWLDSYLLEVGVAKIHMKQVNYGVYFDHCKATELYELIIYRMQRIEDGLQGMLPWEQKIDKHQYKKFFKKGGSPLNCILNFVGEQDGYGPFSKVTFEHSSLTSSTQIKAYLYSLGWKPTEFNISKVTGAITSGKITEDSLDSIGHTSFGKWYKKYVMLDHRRKLLLSNKKTGFLVSMDNRSRIPSLAITCGTPTARYRHKLIANLPRPGTPFGKKLRGLFGVPKGRVQVGCDLSGIEARAMAHYCMAYDVDGELIEKVLSNDKELDFHSSNGVLWGVTRTTAKSGLYCLMYGGGGPKLARTLDKPEREGNKLKRNFWNGNKPLKALKKDVEQAYKMRGYLVGFDGRKILIRQKHKLLNSLFQSFAAMVFKQWMVNVNKWIEEEGIDAHQIIAYHDELQFECAPEIAKSFAKRLCEIARETGEQMGCNVPIEAESKIGMNWADCH